VFQAIGIVGNLALLEDNINKIVEEGGIPILLSVINGASAEADTKEASQRIIESGIRAIGRLLRVEKNAAEFLRFVIRNSVVLLKNVFANILGFGVFKISNSQKQISYFFCRKSQLENMSFRRFNLRRFWNIFRIFPAVFFHFRLEWTFGNVSFSVV